MNEQSIDPAQSPVFFSVEMFMTLRPDDIIHVAGQMLAMPYQSYMFANLIAENFIAAQMRLVSATIREYARGYDIFLSLINQRFHGGAGRNAQINPESSSPVKMLAPLTGHAEHTPSGILRSNIEYLMKGVSPVAQTGLVMSRAWESREAALLTLSAIFDEHSHSPEGTPDYNERVQKIRGACSNLYNMDKTYRLAALEVMCAIGQRNPALHSQTREIMIALRHDPLTEREYFVLGAQIS